MAIADPDSALLKVVEESDDDVNLFGDEDDTITSDLGRALYQRAETTRREKLAQLPPPSQRTCAQNRMAYVLSGQRLQPTKVAHVFSVEECELIIAAVVDYVEKQGGLQTDRHEKFATTDVPASSLSLPLPRDAGDTGKTVGDAILEWVTERVLSLVTASTGFRSQDIGLKDLFVVCYHGKQPKADQHLKRYPIPSKQASLAIHSDGCLLSFSILLNHHDAFDGGGTFFKGTGQTFHVEQGGLLMHDAGLEHAGAEVLTGQRIMLVGFLETVDVLKQKLVWEQQSAWKRPDRQTAS
ncbi:hypothetical protein N0V93_002944 [Gnomoniopsis smithogilvyi]|uniref:Prolyl 4-hydroxylase alpha subunit domain-containing protein n=1 Tax=Gnomoniopsis smithogilvyi TaxID=1191159 RepID=A0A9W8YXE2_9PEZI|nr:hypothetical protein N0V93_002944 [Gnomoniopsis smithogilvyi]